MISSDPVSFTHKNQLATMRVFRNNGHAWGRINILGPLQEGGNEFDVESRRDIYGETDEAACAILIRIAWRFPAQVGPVAGWEGC